MDVEVSLSGRITRFSVSREKYEICGNKLKRDIAYVLGVPQGYSIVFFTNQSDFSDSRVKVVFKEWAGSIPQQTKVLELAGYFAASLSQLTAVNIRQPDVEIDFQPDASAGEQTAKFQPEAAGAGEQENNFELRAAQYAVQEPYWTFESLILPEETKRQILHSLDRLKYERIVFEDWGLRAIEPHARSALNFYGPPGTGKTMAAHAIASRLGKRILIASYASIESKYHGDGPKNVEAIFLAAQMNDAILFIDEADSLLSKRLTNVTQGSEQAINSMRSQLLICLEKFKGIVIFATNLVKNYDYAFETRVKSVHFTLPDQSCREHIWRSHLLPGIPKGEDISLVQLAEKTEGFCGRDIKTAVLEACTKVAALGRVLCQEDLLEECRRILDSKLKLNDAKDDTFAGSNALKSMLESQIGEQLRNQAAATQAG